MRGGGGRAVHRTAHKVARRIGGVSAMQRLRVCPCVHANAQGGKRYSEQELASPSGVTTSRFLDRGPHPQPQRLKLWKSESHIDT